MFYEKIMDFYSSTFISPSTWETYWLSTPDCPDTLVLICQKESGFSETSPCQRISSFQRLLFHTLPVLWECLDFSSVAIHCLPLPQWLSLSRTGGLLSVVWFYGSSTLCLDTGRWKVPVLPSFWNNLIQCKTPPKKTLYFAPSFNFLPVLSI